MIKMLKNLFSRRVDSDAATRAFQAGYRRGTFRNDSWYPESQKARIIPLVDLQRRDLKRLIGVSQYAYRTSSYARRIIDLLRTNVITTALRPNPAVQIDGAPADKINSQLAEIWKRVNDELYRLNGLTAYEAQGLEFTTIAVDGSLLRQTVEARKGSFLNFAYNHVPVSRLDFSHDSYISGMQNQKYPLTILGVQLNEYNEPTGYYFDDGKFYSIEKISLHFKTLEVGAILGLPWLITSLANVNDVDSIMGDVVAQSKILSRFGVFIPKKGREAFDAIIDPDERQDNDQDVIGLDKSQIYFGENKPEAIEFSKDLNQSLAALLKINVSAAAIGAGLSYQAVSSDLADATFSSARVNSILDEHNYSTLRKWFITCNLKPLWSDVVKWSILQGRVEGVAYSDYVRNPWQYEQCFWLPDGQESIDPLKDATADKMLYDMGAVTFQDLCSRQGVDYRAILRQRQKERDEFKSAGLDNLLPKGGDNASQN